MQYSTSNLLTMLFSLIPNAKKNSSFFLRYKDKMEITEEMPWFAQQRWHHLKRHGKLCREIFFNVKRQWNGVHNEKIAHNCESKAYSSLYWKVTTAIFIFMSREIEPYDFNNAPRLEYVSRRALCERYAWKCSMKNANQEGD